MSTSQKTKFPLGKNGQEDPKPELETTFLGETELTPGPEAPAPASSNKESIISDPEPAPVVGVVEESVKPVVTAPLSVTDLKLARRMNKAIAGVLGLSGKSRSVRV